MQSILFAILIAMPSTSSVNIPPAEVQSEEPEKPKQAEADQEVDDNFQRAIRAELFAKMQKRGYWPKSEVLSDADAVQFVQMFSKEFLTELTTAVIDAIKVGDMKRYKALSNLREEYGYTESEIIISASSTIPFEEAIPIQKLLDDKPSEVFEWMRMLVNAESHKEFFTGEIMRILSSALSSDITHFDYFVFGETEQKNNRSALIFLNNVESNKEFLNGEMIRVLSSDLLSDTMHFDYFVFGETEQKNNPSILILLNNANNFLTKLKKKSYNYQKSKK